MSRTFVIQNVDRAVKQREYEQFGLDLLVTSVFRTIQGEGIFAGRSAIFVRLAGCNFGAKDAFCQFCDTSFQFDKGQRMTSLQLLHEIDKCEPHYGNDILVITGGEPTLQPALLSFMLDADRLFDRIQIETNGTQAAFFERFNQLYDRQMYPNSPAKPYICVSPKASNKSGTYATPPKAVLKAADCFKFVVSADKDSPHHEVPQWAFDEMRANRLYGDGQKKLYVSPMAEYKKAYAGEVSSIWDDDLIDKDATRRNYAYAGEYAMRNSVCTVSLQTHLFLGIA